MSHQISRRHFLAASAGATGWELTKQSAQAGSFAPAFQGWFGKSPKREQSKGKRIVKCQLGEAIRYPHKCGGDIWDITWADDDSLYVVNQESSGCDYECSSNIAVHRITGGPPPNVQVVTINAMSEFGISGERKADGAVWKSCGLTCVDGVLYLALGRQINYPPRSRFSAMQDAWDAGIIKSTDHGKSWSPAPKLDHAMFPGRIFSTPDFVQYGRDGKGEKDGADQFVYAISNDGIWENGNWMTMGRVPKALIGRLDARDWEFVQGYDAHDQPIWDPRQETARYVFWDPGRTSMAGIHYIAGLDLYIMPQWYYPRFAAYDPTFISSALGDPEHRWNKTQFRLYQAPAPWGPWTLFHSQDFEPQGWYDPAIPGKFISDDGRRFWIFTTGNFKDTTHYGGLFMIPVTLEVED